MFRCGRLPNATDGATVTEIKFGRSSTVLFYRDVHAELNSWYRDGLKTVDIVLANPPWGHKIGEAGDGARILRQLANQLSTCCQPIVVVAILSEQCLAQVAAPCPKSGDWHFFEQSTLGDDDTVGNKLSVWPIIHCVEIGTSNKKTRLVVLTNR